MGGRSSRAGGEVDADRPRTFLAKLDTSYGQALVPTGRNSSTRCMVPIEINVNIIPWRLHSLRAETEVTSQDTSPKNLSLSDSVLLVLITHLVTCPARLSKSKRSRTSTLATFRGLTLLLHSCPAAQADRCWPNEAIELEHPTVRTQGCSRVSRRAPPGRSHEDYVPADNALQTVVQPGQVVDGNAVRSRAWQDVSSTVR